MWMAVPFTHYLYKKRVSITSDSMTVWNTYWTVNTEDFPRTYLSWICISSWISVFLFYCSGVCLMCWANSWIPFMQTICLRDSSSHILMNQRSAQSVRLSPIMWNTTRMRTGLSNVSLDYFLHKFVYRIA